MVSVVRGDASLFASGWVSAYVYVPTKSTVRTYVPLVPLLFVAFRISVIKIPRKHWISLQPMDHFFEDLRNIWNFQSRGFLVFRVSRYILHFEVADCTDTSYLYCICAITGHSLAHCKRCPENLPDSPTCVSNSNYFHDLSRRRCQVSNFVSVTEF